MKTFYYLVVSLTLCACGGSEINTDAKILGPSLINTVERDPLFRYTYQGHGFEEKSLTFQLSGDDANIFQINGSTGLLTAKSPLVYSSPRDKDKDNNYLLVIEANDAVGNSERRAVKVSVHDYVQSGVVTKILGNAGAFAALRSDGTVSTWGLSSYGGFSDHVDLNNVKELVANRFSFAALKRDGSVVAWGGREYGGAGPNTDLSNIIQLTANQYAFAALDQTGRVFSWGHPNHAGNIAPDNSLGYSAQRLIAFNFQFGALNSGGSISIWRRNSSEVNSQSPDDNEVILVPSPPLPSFTEIKSASNSLAAIDKNGNVWFWKNADILNDYESTADSQQKKFTRLFSNQHGFLAVSEDNSAIYWDRGVEGFQALNDVNDAIPVASKFLITLASGEAILYPFDSEFEEKREFQNVKTAANTELSTVAMVYSDLSLKLFDEYFEQRTLYADHPQFFLPPDNRFNVRDVFSGAYAFSGIGLDQNVFAWGNAFRGGTLKGYSWDGLDNIISGDGDYIIARFGNSVKTFGDDYYTANGSRESLEYMISVDDINFENVDHIYNKGLNHAIRSKDGSTVFWGADNCRMSNVTKILESAKTILALTHSGEIFWCDKNKVTKIELAEPITNIFQTHKGTIVIKPDRNAYRLSFDDSMAATIEHSLFSDFQVETVVSSSNSTLFISPYDTLMYEARLEEAQGPLGFNREQLAKHASSRYGHTLLMKNGDITHINLHEAVTSKQDYIPPPTIDGPVTDVFATTHTHAALTADDRLYVWGNNVYGTADLPEEALSNVAKVVVSNFAIAVLTKQGRLYTSGHSTTGGDSTYLGIGASSFKNVHALSRGFVAIKTDGSAVAIGGLPLQTDVAIGAKWSGE